jgi:predicted NodU family carbamoyl transferase
VIVLGVNSVYHESSAALIRDGKSLAAVEEERFNRRKQYQASLLNQSSVTLVRDDAPRPPCQE